MNLSAKLILAAATLAIAGAAGYAFTRQEVAPEVRFVTLAGDRLSTSDLRGKVVLVNFWATSCVTCVKEMPMLSDTHRKFAPRGYETIAVAMSYDHPNQVAEFAKQRALPFKVAMDTDGSIARQFGNVRVTPTTYLIDKKGRVIKTYLGEPRLDEFHALLEKALGEPA
jgi:peroxiredoxin